MSTISGDIPLPPEGALERVPQSCETLFEDLPDSSEDERVTVPPALAAFFGQLGAPLPAA